MIGAQRRLLARGLARAFLAGAWERTALLERGTQAVGAGGIWLRAVVQQVLAVHPSAPLDSDELTALVAGHADFREVCSRQRISVVRRWFPELPRMEEGPWPVRKLATLSEVAAWLAVSPEQLDWFADRKGFARRTEKTSLQNYRYAWAGKRSGGARLLEAPKSNLKRIQRRILREVLEPIPPHPATHGFRKHCSPLSHAQLHVGRAVVFRFDLRDFFASIPTGRVLGILRAAGYPVQVAKTLLGLCTNRVPLAVLAQAPRATTPGQVRPRFELRRSLAGPHLPQGSPASPALSNLVAYGLDVRLSRFADAFGAVYSRYADDLVFSGGGHLLNARQRIQRCVAQVVAEEGLVLNMQKTAVMTAAQRQQITGIVVNHGLSQRRDDYDRLKATLHNYALGGVGRDPVAAAALRAQLEGRVSWATALNPGRAAKCVRCWGGLIGPPSMASPPSD